MGGRLLPDDSGRAGVASPVPACLPACLPEALGGRMRPVMGARCVAISQHIYDIMSHRGHGWGHWGRTTYYLLSPSLTGQGQWGSGSA